MRKGRREQKGSLGVKHPALQFLLPCPFFDVREGNLLEAALLACGCGAAPPDPVRWGVTASKPLY